MHRTYKCLGREEFTEGDYKLVAIREEDKYAIMQWRNEQLDILRQKELLTKEKQESYFRNVVDKLFEREKPEQLLFSFLENDRLIGYGGLVHIDWESGNGEISFITATERNKNPDQFKNDWKHYLEILKKVADRHLGFAKVYTYAYDIRPHLYEVLTESGFSEEARLKNHIRIHGKLHDVLIHSFLFNEFSLRKVTEKDMQLLFDWANDETVRENSFNQGKIELEEHKNWFQAKIGNLKNLMLIACLNETEVGQIRFNTIDDLSFEIDFSVEKKSRGKGIGGRMIRMGVQELFASKPLAKRVIGKVKKNNFSSGKSFLNAGFRLEENKDNNGIEIYYLDKPIA